MTKVSKIPPQHPQRSPRESLAVPVVQTSATLVSLVRKSVNFIRGWIGSQTAKQHALNTRSIACALFNDVSARDWQREPAKAGPVPQWGFSKSFDKYAPLGPCLTSSEILGAADNLDLETRVNDEIRQTGNTSDFCFGVRDLVAFCSKGQTPEKGSPIMTGTPGGVGLFMKPEPKFLRHGDVVEVRIQGIGKLVNQMDFQDRK